MSFIINVMMIWRVWVCAEKVISHVHHNPKLWQFSWFRAPIVSWATTFHMHAQRAHIHTHAALKSDFIDSTMIRIMLNSYHNYKPLLTHTHTQFAIEFGFCSPEGRGRGQEKEEKENGKLPFHLKIKIKIEIKIPENDLLSTENLMFKPNILYHFANPYWCWCICVNVCGIVFPCTCTMTQNGMIKINDSIRNDAYQKSIFPSDTHAFGTMIDSFEYSHILMMICNDDSRYRHVEIYPCRANASVCKVPNITLCWDLRATVV